MPPGLHASTASRAFAGSGASSACNAARRAGRARPRIGGKGIDDPAAAHGAPAGLVPDDEAVAGRRLRRAIEMKLCERAPPGGDLASFEQRDAGAQKGGAEMQVQGSPVTQGPLLALEDPQPHVDTPGGEREPFAHHPVAPLQRVPADAAQVQREALSGPARGHAAVAGLDPPDPHPDPPRLHEQTIAHRHAPGKGGAGGHHPGSGDAEGAVHGSRKFARAGAGIEGDGALHEVRFEGADARAGGGAHRQDGRAPRAW